MSASSERRPIPTNRAGEPSLWDPAAGRAAHGSTWAQTRARVRPEPEPPGPDHLIRQGFAETGLTDTTYFGALGSLSMAGLDGPDDLLKHAAETHDILRGLRQLPKAPWVVDALRFFTREWIILRGQLRRIGVHVSD